MFDLGAPRSPDGEMLVDRFRTSDLARRCGDGW